jgi:hypothetical protein
MQKKKKEGIKEDVKRNGKLCFDWAKTDPTTSVTHTLLDLVASHLITTGQLAGLLVFHLYHADL